VSSWSGPRVKEGYSLADDAFKNPKLWHWNISLYISGIFFWYLFIHLKEHNQGLREKCEKTCDFPLQTKFFNNRHQIAPNHSAAICGQLKELIFNSLQDVLVGVAQYQFTRIATNFGIRDILKIVMAYIIRKSQL
jgi:hypothetical protein